MPAGTRAAPTTRPGPTGSCSPTDTRGGGRDIGLRQSESVYEPWSPDYFLWVWENPSPDVPIATVELSAHVDGILVAAITTSDAGEHPFAREAARTVRFTVEGADVPFTELVVKVDRGVASYAYRLPSEGVDAFLDDPLRGWGDDVPAETPTRRVDRRDPVGDRHGEGRRPRDRGVPLGGPGTTDRSGRAGSVSRSSSRAGTGSTSRCSTTRPDGPCRAGCTSARRPACRTSPTAHHDHVNAGLGTWHIDIGGDLRLGQATYAYIDGACQGWLPARRRPRRCGSRLRV